MLTKRKRSRVACDTCRTMKRKCDGANPCGPCLRFEYECGYQKPRETTAPAPDATAPASDATAPDAHRVRVEANSGPAFVRRLALTIDCNNAPRMHMFAWNLFLGARECRQETAPLTEMLTRREMESLAEIYFQSFDPIYGFVDREELERQIARRWQDKESTEYDAVFCGVAAIGSLFSNVQPPVIEHRVATLLQQTLSLVPTISNVTAWVLRTAYLKLTGTPHEAWMASCTLMHMVEAAGLHCEPPTALVLPLASNVIDTEIQRRLYGVAQHLNIWMSYDLGRSRVSLHGATTLLPTRRRPGDATIELLELLPYSAMLDPERGSDAAELESAMLEVLNRTHSVPPSQMAQCNLVLCFCRRLQALNVSLSGSHHDRILAQISKGIRAAEALLERRAPWHHMANVPFSVICVLLAMDTVATLSKLPDSMQILSRIAQTYNTEATREALETASLLIYLYQKRKEKTAERLREVLRSYPVRQETVDHDDTGWLNDLVADIPNLQDFDIDQFLNQGAFF